MTYETPLLDAACHFDQLKPATQIILRRCFFFFELDRQEGLKKAIFPEIKTIAKMSGYGITTVKKSLNELEQFNLIKRTGRYFQSNHYEIDKNIFELLFLLHSLPFYSNWKRCRLEIIKGLSEDECFLAEKLYRKGYLSTTKVSTTTLQKVSTIKSLLLRNPHLDVRTKSRTQVMNKDEGKSKERGLLQDIPITEKDKKWLSENYAFVDLRKARDDYEVYHHKWGKHVFTPGGFLNGQARKHAKNRLFQGKV